MNKIQSITKGSEIIDKIFLEIVSMLRSKNVYTEIQIANQIKKLARQFGGQGMAFPSIVSFGKNAVEIHHKPSTTKIGRNNFLMLDYGVKVNGFCSDFTRTLFLGQPTKVHENFYDIVLLAQRTAIKKIAVGKPADEIDFAARHVINQAGLGKYYTHGTGHGVTKKIHDSPSFKPNSGDIIKKDDVVTIEPGIYLPGKFGIRIEDMILVGQKSKIFSKIPTDFRSMILK
jgi:Xaa-Pro aminopeptidase